MSFLGERVPGFVMRERVTDRQSPGSVGTVDGIGWICDRAVVTVTFDPHMDWPAVRVRFCGAQVNDLLPVTAPHGDVCF